MAKKKTTARRTTTTRTPALTLKITGTDIGSGRIPIPDLVVICEQAQQAVDRQAEAIEGKRTLRPGPTIEKVRRECTLELVGVGKGSAVLMFEQAKPQAVLPEMPSLGTEAIEKVALAIESISRGKKCDVDEGVLDSLNKMGELFHNGVKSVQWIVPGRAGRKRVQAKFDDRVRERVARRLRPPMTRQASFDGMLEMADFKPSDFRCRIHPTLGPVINCSFDQSMADEVYAALRHPVHIEGRATVNTATERIENLQITDIKPLEPLNVNAGSFFHGWTFDELVRVQAVQPVHDLKTLATGSALDEEVDEFLADVYQRRV